MVGPAREGALANPAPRFARGNKRERSLWPRRRPLQNAAPRENLQRPPPRPHIAVRDPEPAQSAGLD